MKGRLTGCIVLLVLTLSAQAQEEQLIKYGNFEKWITRHIKESGLLGGDTKTLMEIGPTKTIDENAAYVNLGGSPWATSNVYAKVCGVVKASAGVYQDKHGSGSCAKLVTHVEKCKAIGFVKVNVLAAGSIFTGQMHEPITSTKNPMSKMSMGMPFTKRPSALKFDYKVELSSDANRIKQTGGSASTVSGKDYPDMICILQKRWEDSKGNIHAQRIGTAIHRFTSNCGWKEDQSFTIHYGDITGQSYYKSWMGLMTGDQTMYATNSKGRLVKIFEEGWGSADDTPTHAVVKFDSSYGGTTYIGSPGTTFWVDNVTWVY